MDKRSLSLFFVLMLLLAFSHPAAARRYAGGEPAKGAPRKSLAYYTITQCQQTATNAAKSLAAPLTVYLEQHRRGRLALRELNSRQAGLIVVNHWTDQDGDHFFLYTKHVGYEYIVPFDRKKPGVRLVYTRGSFRAVRAPGRVIKVAGSPAERCEMLPPGGRPVTTVSATPETKEGCVKDTDCKGWRVCENGHCVSPPSDTGDEAEKQPSSDESSGAPNESKKEPSPGATNESKKQPSGSCRNDLDCDGEKVCKNKKCVSP